MVGEEKRKSNPRPWKYTDDIVAVLIILAWILGKPLGVEVPDWALSAVLGYIFGKNIPLPR